MGFEVKLIYCEKVGDEYDKENHKEMFRKLGNFSDDIPLEKLAITIMMQMARRDILVIDAEVFEYKKTKVNFRETQGGIVIKNKKFLFDIDANMVSQNIIESQSPDLTCQLQDASVAGQANGQLVSIPMQPHNQGQLRPVKYMIFAPELQMMPEVKQKGLRFTPDKKYPIFQIQPHPSGVGEVFKMIDDTNREQLVSDKYFVPEPVLYADRELGFSQNQAQRDGGKLLWGDAHREPNMPDVRR